MKTRYSIYSGFKLELNCILPLTSYKNSIWMTAYTEVLEQDKYYTKTENVSSHWNEKKICLRTKHIRDNHKQIDELFHRNRSNQNNYEKYLQSMLLTRC